MEVDRSVEIGALGRVNCSEWAAPSFVIPKKDGTVHFINNFREFNKRIQQKPHHPIPNVQDMLLNLEGFQCATSLCLNVGCHHIELSPASKKLCTLASLAVWKVRDATIACGLMHQSQHLSGDNVCVVQRIGICTNLHQ